jgi:hypothetical protein
MNNKPAAWMMVNRENTSAYLTFDKPTRDMKISHEPHELYTHPAELTDEEIYRLLADSIWAVGLNIDCLDEQNWADGITVARAILRKAQEK